MLFACDDIHATHLHATILNTCDDFHVFETQETRHAHHICKRKFGNSEMKLTLIEIEEFTHFQNIVNVERLMLENNLDMEF